MRWLILLCVIAACSGEDSSGGPYVPIDQIAQSYKDAQCKHLVMCGSFADQATCLAANVPSNFFVSPDMVEAVLEGKMYYDGGRLAACFDAIASQTCDRTDADGRVQPKACTSTFRGALASGAMCALDSECVSEVCAKNNCGELTCCKGTCVGDTPPAQPVEVPIGTACDNGHVCMSTAYCDTNGLCAALKPVGVACNSQNECDFGLYCTSTTTTMQCKALPTLGQPCAPDFQCRDEGQYCSSTTQVCTKIGLPGTQCSSFGDCSSFYRCDSTVMQCAAYPSIGQSCAVLSRCNDANSFCDQTTQLCTALLPDGQPCTSSTQCISSFCDTSVSACASPPTCT
jgi:hypothetical protein